MAGMDDIDIFAGPERDMMGVPITGSNRDSQLDALRGMARQKYVDPVENRAKDMVKMQVAEALSSVPGIKGEAISSIIALADSQNPDDKLMFNQIASRLDLPVDVRRMGDDYAVSKRFEDVLGDNSSVGVSAFLPDEGDNQYSLSAEKRFPNFLGGEARVGGNISTSGDPEIRASFMKRFAEGGDVDIFDRTASMMNPLGPVPSMDRSMLSPAQLANIAGGFAPGAGAIEMSGGAPEYPDYDITTGEMITGPRSPSMAEDFDSGEYLSGALKGLGGIGDLASVIPAVGPLIAGALKSPRAIQKALMLSGRLQRAKEAGFDTDSVYYHGADADIKEFRMPSRETGQTKTVGTGVFMSSSPEVAGSYSKGENAVLYPVYINKSKFLKIRPTSKGQFWSDISTDGLVVEFPDGTTKPATEVFDLEDSFTTTDELSQMARAQGHKGLIVQDVIDAGIGSAGEYRYTEKYLKDKGYDVSFPMGTTKESFDEIQAIPSEVMSEARMYAKEKLYRPSNIVVSFDPKNIRSVNAEFEDLDTAEISKAEGGEIRKFSKGGIADLIIKGYFDARFDPRAKEQDMLANLEAEIIGSNYTQPMPRLALSELEGEQFVTSMADRTRAGGDVKSINRVQLVDPIHLPGGQDFMFNNPSGVWASAEQPSSQILELARELKSQSGRDPLYIPWRMAPTGGDFSTTTGELMLGYAAANMTKTTRKALDKAIRSYRTKGSMKDGRRVGAGLKVDGWKGIDDPSSVEVWRNTPDPIRKELMKMMDVQFRNKGGLSIGAARLINADPKQLMARDAGVQNVGRIFSDIDIFESDHPSYPFVVPGGGVGVLKNASAATAFDMLPEARFGDAQKKVKDPANPTQQEIRALQMKPYGGTITEEILRRMEARGVDINSISGLTGGALTFTLLSAGLVTPQEAEAGGIKQFVNDIPKADSVKQAKEQGFNLDNVMYHASKQDIDEFVPGYADGLTFLTPNKEFANNWLGKGKFQERQGGTGAIEGVRAEKKRFGEEIDKILESLPEDQRDQYYEEILLPQQQQLLRDEQLADSAIYPVVTKTKKPFVPHKDYEVLEELFGEEKMNEGFEVGGSFIMGMPTYGDALKSGNYLLYENPEVVEFLKSKGYDSMFLKESTETKANRESPEYSTFAVFEPSDIRSVNAKFDPKEKGSPKILATGLLATGLAAMGSSQKARADTLAAQGATHEMVLDALSGGVAPVVGGVAGLAEYTTSVPERLRGGDEAGEKIAARVKAVREGVAEGLNYEPTSEMGRSMSKSAQEGIAGLLQPAIEYAKPEIKQLMDYIQSEEQRNSPLGALYRGGKYVYEDIFGEAEREAAKSAMDAAI